MTRQNFRFKCISVRYFYRQVILLNKTDIPLPILISLQRLIAQQCHIYVTIVSKQNKLLFRWIINCVGTLDGIDPALVPKVTKWLKLICYSCFDVLFAASHKDCQRNILFEFVTQTEKKIFKLAISLHLSSVATNPNWKKNFQICNFFAFEFRQTNPFEDSYGHIVWITFIFFVK